MNIDKPEVDFPIGDAPTDLQIEDLWEGDGAEAKAGDFVKVHYVGVSFSTGEEFDASWNRGNPLEFQLGAGQVIAGWDKGVQGMKVGGRHAADHPGAPRVRRPWRRWRPHRPRRDADLRV